MRRIDYLVVAIYVTTVFAVGLVSRGRKRNADDYFTSHGTFRGRLGSSIIGLSIAASYFSGFSVIVFTSFAYSTGLQLMLGLIACPVAWVVLKFWFLDRYWTKRHVHPYDIVETRFGYTVRAALSLMFVLMRIGWMAVVIYAPTVIIMGALGLGQAWFWPTVLTVGGVCTVISVVGGLRAVIIVDAVQFLVIALGVVFTIVLILVRMHWGFAGIWADLLRGHHLQMFDFTLSFTAPWTIWAIVIGQIVANVGMYLSDQIALQRYLASESPSAVCRSFAINVLGAYVVGGLLTVVGLLLVVWYLHHPDPGLPHNPDQVLPYYATHELPPGMAGLLIAAILAATMNTVTSGINSMAGAITNDFLARIGRQRSPAELFGFGRIVSGILGLVVTCLAGLASQLGSLLVSSNKVTGTFQGPMFACMLWAVAGVRVRPLSLLMGMILGSVAGLVVASSQASSFWVAPAGFAVAVFVPWLDSLIRVPTLGTGDTRLKNDHEPH